MLPSVARRTSAGGNDRRGHNACKHDTIVIMKTPAAFHRVVIGLLLAAHALFFGVHAARAQQPTAQTQPTDSETLSLAAKQQRILERVERLENRMLQLARLLAETDPAKAERLRDAHTRLGHKEIKRRIAQLAKQLDENAFDSADAQQQRVLQDLQTLLQFMTDPASHVDRFREERKRLQRLQRGIQKLIDAQLEHLQQTRLLLRDHEAADALQVMIDKLEAAADALPDTQYDAADDEDPGAANEVDLDAMSQSLRELAERLADAAARQATQAAADDVSNAQRRRAQAADASQANQPEETEQAEARERPSDQRDSDKPAEAESHLRRAIRRLQQARDTLRDEDAIRRLEERQRQTEQRTGEIARELRDEEAQGKPAAGRQGVESAQQSMQRSADRMSEQDFEKSQQQQQQALRQLEETMRELDDVLRQTREEELTETLTALQVRIERLLNMQREVSEVVEKLTPIAPETWQQDDRLRLNEAAQQQSAIARDSSDIMDILIAEGTTVVLPEMMGQVRDDAAAIEEHLANQELSPITQRMIADVIALLEQILGSVRTAAEQQQQGMQDGQNPQGPPTGSQPLLPPSAELKLLRTAQVRVNDRTAALIEGKLPQGESDAAESDSPQGSRKDPVAQLHRELRRLADRQRQLTDMALRMHGQQ